MRMYFRLSTVRHVAAIAIYHSPYVCSFHLTIAGSVSPYQRFVASLLAWVCTMHDTCYTNIIIPIIPLHERRVARDNNDIAADDLFHTPSLREGLLIVIFDVQKYVDC